MGGVQLSQQHHAAQIQTDPNERELNNHKYGYTLLNISPEKQVLFSRFNVALLSLLWMSMKEARRKEF